MRLPGAFRQRVQRAPFVEKQDLVVVQLRRRQVVGDLLLPLVPPLLLRVLALRVPRALLVFQKRHWSILHFGWAGNGRIK